MDSTRPVDILLFRSRQCTSLDNSTLSRLAACLDSQHLSGLMACLDRSRLSRQVTSLDWVDLSRQLISLRLSEACLDRGGVFRDGMKPGRLKTYVGAV